MFYSFCVCCHTCFIESFYLTDESYNVPPDRYGTIREGVIVIRFLLVRTVTACLKDLVV